MFAAFPWKLCRKYIYSCYCNAFADITIDRMPRMGIVLEAWAFDCRSLFEKLCERRVKQVRKDHRSRMAETMECRTQNLFSSYLNGSVDVAADVCYQLESGEGRSDAK